jgi:uncharacterized repeat protein (TIGR03803 family)
VGHDSISFLGGFTMTKLKAWEMALALSLFCAAAEGQTGKILVSFDGADGVVPSRLVQGRDGSLYGTAYHGGADGYGTVFDLTSAGKLVTLHSFEGTDGESPLPYGPLALGTEGSLYGTTYPRRDPRRRHGV